MAKNTNTVEEGFRAESVIDEIKRDDLKAKPKPVPPYKKPAERFLSFEEYVMFKGLSKSRELSFKMWCGAANDTIYHSKIKWDEVYKEFTSRSLRGR